MTVAVKRPGEALTYHTNICAVLVDVVSPIFFRSDSSKHTFLSAYPCSLKIFYVDVLLCDADVIYNEHLNFLYIHDFLKINYFQKGCYKKYGLFIGSSES